MPLPSEAFETPDGIYCYPVLSNSSDIRAWHPTVDLERGEVWCDCPDCARRQRWSEENGLLPCLWTPQFWCKHILWLIVHLVRVGKITVAPY